MSAHCPACLIVRDLTSHRDATAADWSHRRAALTFAMILARRACPGYAPPLQQPMDEAASVAEQEMAE